MSEKNKKYALTKSEEEEKRKKKIINMNAIVFKELVDPKYRFRWCTLTSNMVWCKICRNEAGEAIDVYHYKILLLDDHFIEKIKRYLLVVDDHIKAEREYYGIKNTDERQSISTYSVALANEIKT